MTTRSFLSLGLFFLFFLARHLVKRVGLLSIPEEQFNIDGLSIDLSRVKHWFGIPLSSRRRSTKPLKAILHTEFEQPYELRLSRLSWRNKLLKRQGIVREFHLDGRASGEPIIVESDTPTVVAELLDSVDVCHALAVLFSGQCQQVSYDGRTLRADFPGDVTSVADMAGPFAVIGGALSKLSATNNEKARSLADRVTRCEAAVWGMAAAGVTSAFLLWISEYRNTSLLPFLVYGGCLGVIGLLLWITFVRRYLKESSHKYRTLQNSWVVMGMGLPLFLAVLAGDINRLVPVSERTKIEVKIISTEYYRKRIGGRGKHSKGPYLYLDKSEDSVQQGLISERLAVSPKIFESIDIRRPAYLTLRKGILGVHWIEAITQ